jgi:dienelactone hydrolase
VATFGLALAIGACTAPVPATAPPPAVALRAPAVAAVTYPVGLRLLRLRRGPHRPLPTLVFYPAAVPSRYPQRPSGTPRAGAEPAPGRFPLVLFSHGLTGTPKRYAAALATWAAAGFMVAAPSYPYTNQFADPFRRADIVHQPADARYVLNRVRRLGVTRGDPLWHRIDGDHVAAVGHSAGGYTTTGLFTAGHDPRLRAGVIMAGWAAPGAFAGPSAEMLFVQGTADPLVPVRVSRAVYARVPWPKSYLLLRRESHGTYLLPGGPGYRRMNAVVLDFLRWTLRGEQTARRRLPSEVHPPLRALESP